MTKGQLRLKARYLKLLKKCGHRSWVRADRRRFNLIIGCGADTNKLSDNQKSELAALQRLADYRYDYVMFKYRGGPRRRWEIR